MFTRATQETMPKAKCERKQHATLKTCFQGRSQNCDGGGGGGGSWGACACDSPFCKPFLSKQPTADGENGMTVWWVPSLWHSVTPPPPPLPPWKLLATPLVLIGDLHDGVIWLPVPESLPFAFGKKASERFQLYYPSFSLEIIMGLLQQLVTWPIISKLLAAAKWILELERECFK